MPIGYDLGYDLINTIAYKYGPKDIKGVWRISLRYEGNKGRVK